MRQPGSQSFLANKDMYNTSTMHVLVGPTILIIRSVAPRNAHAGPMTRPGVWRVKARRAIEEQHVTRGVSFSDLGREGHPARLAAGRTCGKDRLQTDYAP